MRGFLDPIVICWFPHFDDSRGAIYMSMSLYFDTSAQPSRGTGKITRQLRLLLDGIPLGIGGPLILRKKTGMGI